MLLGADEVAAADGSGETANATAAVAAGADVPDAGKTFVLVELELLATAAVANVGDSCAFSGFDSVEATRFAGLGSASLKLTFTTLLTAGSSFLLSEECFCAANI